MNPSNLWHPGRICLVLFAFILSSSFSFAGVNPELLEKFRKFETNNSGTSLDFQATYQPIVHIEGNAHLYIPRNLNGLFQLVMIARVRRTAITSFQKNFFIEYSGHRGWIPVEWDRLSSEPWHAFATTLESAHEPWTEWERFMIVLNFKHSLRTLNLHLEMSGQRLSVYAVSLHSTARSKMNGHRLRQGPKLMKRIRRVRSCRAEVLQTQP